MDTGSTSYREIHGKRRALLFGIKHRRRKTIVKMTLEARLIQAHIMLQAQKAQHGSKFVPLARHGAYEVRLFELTDGPAGKFIFWIELFDCDRRASIDSGGANDVEEASTIADHLALRAQNLSEE
jgi:hypothetical protein